MNVTIKECRCKTCRFWDDLRTGPLIGSCLGLCRRHAPTGRRHKLIADEDTVAVWTETQDDDWCGEYEPRGK